MVRIMVCGCSGSGKSTFARKLVSCLGLPYISIDAHYWQPGWVPGTHEALRERLAPRYAEDAWISDGNYFGALGDIHLRRATHVYYFDLPRWKSLSGGFWRIANQFGKVRPEMAPGCPERLDWEFFRYIWTYNTEQKPKVLEHFKTMRPDQHFLMFQTRQQADAEIIRITREGLR